jgi:periplasmic copper chaperone A
MNRQMGSLSAKLIVAGTVLAWPLSGAAHVVFAVPEVTAGGRATASLRIGHGCEGTATRSIAITMPEGVSRVTPRALAGWTVTIEKRRLDRPVMQHGFEVNEVVSRLVWTGGNVPDDLYEEFEFRFTAPETPGETLYFPVEQICERGSWNWVSIPGPTERWEDMNTPAPFFRILPRPVQP